MGHRPQLEELLTRVREAAADKTQVCLLDYIVSSGNFKIPGSCRSLSPTCLVHYFSLDERLITLVAACCPFGRWGLSRVPCHRQDEAVSGAVPSAVPGGQAFINKHIQALAQKYCGDCKVAFDELSKIIQVM